MPAPSIFHLRQAMPADNAALIRLTQACPMEGKIALRIDRKPDFFSLVRQRGPSRVFVVEKEGLLVGCISLSLQNLHWGGQVLRTMYIADFKVHPDHRRSRTAFLLMRQALEMAQQEQLDLAYLLTPDGNAPLLRLLSGRSIFPPFEHLCTFEVHEFRPKGKGGREAVGKVESRKAFELWSAYQKRFCMGRQIEWEAFQEEVAESETEFVGIEVGGQVKCLVGLCDTGKFKQNVVVGMPALMRFGVGVQRQAAKLFGMAPLPGMKEGIRMLAVKYWAVEQGSEQCFQELLQHSLQKARTGGFSFLSMGTDPKNPLFSILKKHPKFTFQSQLHAALLPFGGKDLSPPSSDTIYTVDFAIV